MDTELFMHLPSDEREAAMQLLSWAADQRPLAHD